MNLLVNLEFIYPVTFARLVTEAYSPLIGTWLVSMDCSMLSVSR